MSWSERADRMLSTYVDGSGRVDYEALARETPLGEILEGFAAQDPRGFPSERDALAFYLNAYNVAAVAIVLRLASAEGRVLQDGLRGLWTRARFFLLERVRIAGRSRTLFGLEFLTIRRRFRDPRIHFALVCATKSCPPLRDGMYSGPTLDEELESAAAHFMRPGVGYAVDRDAGIVTFHRIFRWYRRDFRPIGGAAGALSRWGDPEDAAYVRTDAVRIRYARYDWGLNDARPTRAPS